MIRCESGKVGVKSLRVAVGMLEALVKHNDRVKYPMPQEQLGVYRCKFCTGLHIGHCNPRKPESRLALVIPTEQGYKIKLNLTRIFER